MWGLTGPGADQLRARASRQTVIELWPANARPWELFMSVATQWRYAGMTGTIVGLDYVAAELVLRAKGVKLGGETMADLQACESGALQAFRARDERRAAEERSRRG
ncbi:DUF1799 domain-containing protein [Zavarzinia aquatilis]|uniref:DUF1799 domain-containing protein n=1 Tax=Zavarzinia aquatilis TaxID=2211142 RepID=A0A317DTF7_9PROT|nr:DUF1799 domain-containing protein [Zavarzinia aquatilis]PWR17632.1 hypothetical protein DKG74_20705 [Zavarzinia aquatilis]